MNISYLTLLQSANLVNSDKTVKLNSWFNVTQRKNKNIKNKIIPVHYEYTYINTKK